MQTCAICGQAGGHRSFQVKEMQHCLHELFDYFQCRSCGCIQIATIPGNMARYYPSDYYSFSDSLGNELLEKRAGFFQRHQAAHLVENKSMLGKLFSIGYRPPALFEWLRNFSVLRHDRILDIGTGTGWLLKKLWHYGYEDLTGADPFIRQDYTFPGKLRILKIDPLQLDESRPYHLVMMHHSLEHMSDQDAIFHKINRLLVPGGKLLVRIPVYSQALMDKFGTHLVSLDAPRHFFVHSTESLGLVAARNGFAIKNIVFDADSSSLWASEQYRQGICLNAPNSYGVSRKASPFSKDQIRQFKKEIRSLNEQNASDTAAFYLEKMTESQKS